MWDMHDAYKDIISYETNRYRNVLPGDIEDMAQEVWMRLLSLERSGKLNDAKSRKYVGTHARYTCAGYIREQANGFKVPLTMIPEKPLVVWLSEQPVSDTDETYADMATDDNALWASEQPTDSPEAQFQPDIQRYVERLPAYQQRALRGRYLGTGETYHKDYLTRAHNALRKMMTEQESEQ